MLWNYATADLYLRNAAPLPDNPSALLEAAVRQLGEIDLAKLMSDVSDLATQLDAAAHAEERIPR